MSLLSFFNKKAVWAFAFEVIISIVKFALEGTEYGMLVEGDFGRMTFQ